MSGANFLETLLDGAAVEWVALSDVAKYVRGLVYNKSSESADDQGYKVLRANNITLIGNSLNFDDVKVVNLETKVKDSQKLYKGDILISAASGSREHVGKVAFINSDIDYYFGGFMGAVRCGVALNPRFLFHIFVSDIFKQYLDEMLNSSTINNINSAVMGAFRIPIPYPDNPAKSLEIQREIVRILDNFTELTAELTAELSARKKQYNYYRDQLLSVVEGEVPLIPLSQCCESIADGDHQAPQKTENGIPFITISDVSATSQIDFSNTKFVSHSYYEGLDSKRKARTNDILYTVVGSFGIPVYIDSDKKFAFQRHIAILRPNPEIAIPKYIYHALRSSSVVKQACSVATGAAQKTITLTALNRMQIAVPPLAKQARIVAILDKFDALTNSITEGLPREIELRQKQYAYYRDLLLSFPKPQEVAA